MELRFNNETNKVDYLIREIKKLEKEKDNIESILKIFWTTPINYPKPLETNHAKTKGPDIRLHLSN